MQENHRAHLSLTQSMLPWAVAALALLLYLVTLNRWVTLDSLPYVAKVTGWDWTLPYQTPLFFILTYPFRLLPASWQPISLNLFSAACAALTLALLARSVALLPHDRTHEQRLRERSEFSLLSIPVAWLPPVLAVAVCGLELTFWEHATAATNEMLDLLLFAYVIRCLLEFRVQQRDSWLTRMSFVYGLAVTNNFAMIGFFPCVLVAVLWIKGRSFFDFRFFARMLGWGILGLSLYLVLPLIWALSDSVSVSFGQALRAQLAAQKAMLFDAPLLRTRVLILSLTSILPLLIIGIRWPATFGDTSAAGAALSSVMFRVVHTVFLAACIWVAFNQQFSPRALGFGVVPFLSFYYLGALSIGYFSGYLLLVSSESRSRSRHRRSGLQLLMNRLVIAAIWATLVAVPVALVAKNWKNVRTTNGPLLRQFADLTSGSLPGRGIVLSDDPYGLLLLSASLSQHGTLKNYLLVHTRSLMSSDYHRQMSKRYPSQWVNYFSNQPPDEVIDDGSLLVLMTALSRTNELVYLHPSFGYYFEQFYPRPQGLVYRLQSYSTNAVYPPPLDARERQTNEAFWANLDKSLDALLASKKVDSRDVAYVSRYYSRALNQWGVTLQRDSQPERGPQLEQAAKCFTLAAELNTNNVAAQSNADFNRVLRTGGERAVEDANSIEEKFGANRRWEPMLMENGPFDHPDFCLRLGQIFAVQTLYRQAAIELDRARTLETITDNVVPQIALADVLLRAQLPTQALEEIAKLRAKQRSDPLPQELEVELVRLEASAQFALQKTEEAERILREAAAQYPKYPGILDTLLQIYAQSDRLPEALSEAEKMVKAHPERIQSFINQAALYAKNQELDKAVRAVEQVLQKAPQHPQALLYKVFLLIQKKDYDQARATIETLLKEEPDNPEALLYKGVVEIETNNHAAAIEPLTAILKHQPHDGNALRNRAIAYLQLGDLAKAEKDYDTIRRLSARDSVYVAYFGLGEIAYKRNDMDTARKYYNLYLQYAPKTETPELAEEKKMVITRLEGLKEARR